jgi:pimeloyl-ACP methyl ester carboxylesterase
VLVHGSLTNHITAWMLVTPLLQPHFTVYAVDRRGRGETTATEGHTIPEEGADIAALIDAIDEPVFVLGHSFGAQISLAAAAQLPNRVRKLALYEPPLPSAMPKDVLAGYQAQASGGDYEGIVDDFFRNVVKVPATEVDLIQTTPVWGLLVADGPASIREWPALIDYEFDATRFRNLEIPVLLITGSESPPHLYATDALAAALPHVKVEVMAGQGHGANVMAPQRFAEIVTTFLLQA